MNRPTWSPLEIARNEISVYISSFLRDEIGIEQLKNEFVRIKENYLATAQRVEENEEMRKLVPIETALLQWISIKNYSWVVITDFASLYTALQKRKQSEQHHGSHTVAHQEATHVLGFMDATTEAESLWIHVQIVAGTILPEDIYEKKTTPQRGNKERAPRWFNKIVPLFEVLEQHFTFDKTNTAHCQWFSWAITPLSSRTQSYVTFVCPVLNVSILVNNMYGQWVYIIPWCVDEKTMCTISKQWRQYVHPENPQKFFAYYVADPVQHTLDLQQRKNEIVEKVGLAQQQAWTAPVSYDDVPLPQKVSSRKEKQKAVFQAWFEEQTYEALMWLSRDQLREIKVTVWWTDFGIRYIAALFWNDNKKNDPTTTRGFYTFITKIFWKPSLEQVFTTWFKQKTYNTLSQMSESEIDAITIPIGSKSFSIKQIASTLWNDNDKDDPRSSTGFRKFIHFTVFKKSQQEYEQRFPSLEYQKNAYLQWLQQQWYEQLMRLTAKQVRSLKHPTWKAMKEIATILWNDNKTHNPKNAWEFRWFIHFIVFWKTENEYENMITKVKKPYDNWSKREHAS